jgi:hypothetical protein
MPVRRDAALPGSARPKKGPRTGQSDQEEDYGVSGRRLLTAREDLIIVERVAGSLGAHPDPGPGDVDRAVRQALAGLWVPPAIAEPPRWSRDTPRFDRASKRA